LPAPHQSLNMWYYFTCMYGPGHQSESDGFRDMPDDMSGKEVADSLIDEFRDYDWPTIRVWKIDKPPAQYIEKEIARFKSIIKDKTKCLRKLQSLGDGAGKFSELGEDDEIQKALKGRIRHSVMQQLHKRGIIVSSNTVHRWSTKYEPREKPLKKYREAALKAIKASKKYSGLG
jgi:hypothetical protein